MKKVKYLAIEREYGSGGTDIARRIGANTGVPCYGKEILEHVSGKLHMSVDELERYEEKVTGSILYTFYMMAQAHSASSDMLTKEGQIYVEEQSQIQRLAKQGSAIFLGHCACEALKEEDGIIKVFIFCSDKEQKQERIMRDYGIKKADVNSVRERFDRKRANYYQANTGGGKWKDSANYDIMLDSARLGIDGCVGILEGLLLC
jgi:cytidylate kinase